MIISFQKCAVGSPEMENEFAKSHVLYQGRIEEKWVFGCSRHWKRKRSLFHSPDSQLTELKRTWAFSFTLNFLTLLSRSSTRPFCPFSSICPPCPFSESLSCSLVSMQYLFIFYLVSPHRLCACVFLPLFICLIFFFRHYACSLFISVSGFICCCSLSHFLSNCYNLSHLWDKLFFYHT